MKPIDENVLIREGHSCLFRRDRIRYDRELGYHSHPQLELTAVAVGAGTRTINEYSAEFSAGDVVLTPSGMPHCWTFDPMLCPPDGMIDESCVQFSPDFLNRAMTLMPELGDLCYFLLNLRQPLEVRGETARYVADTFKVIMNFTPDLKSVALLQMLTLIFRRGEFNYMETTVDVAQSPTKARMRFHRVNKFIIENYNRPVSLGEAAELAGMNPTSFCNAFKRYSGMSFNACLTRHRLNAAARLLVTTHLNVSEIAFRVGFNDAPHFTRTFTRHFGESPTDYRNRRLALEPMPFQPVADGEVVESQSGVGYSDSEKEQ